MPQFAAPSAVALETLTPLVGSMVSRVDTGMIYQAIRRAAREFCFETGIWTAEIDENDGLVTVADQSDYSLTLLTQGVDAEIHRVNWVKVNDVAEHYSRWAFERPATLSFETAPSVADYAITVEGVLVPTATWTDISADLVAGWGDAFALGARAILFGTPNRAWTDYRAADYERHQFEVKMGSAKGIRLTQRQARPLRAKMRKF